MLSKIVFWLLQKELKKNLSESHSKKRNSSESWCYKKLKLKKFSLKKSPAVEFNFFVKEIAVHYKLQTKQTFIYIK